MAEVEDLFELFDEPTEEKQLTVPIVIDEEANDEITRYNLKTNRGLWKI